MNWSQISKSFQAAAVAGALAACGSAGPAAPTPSPPTLFLYCPAASPAYVQADAPRSGCRELRAGRDFADGRVLIGVRTGTAKADLQGALDAYHATELTPPPAAGQVLLEVPAGTVPEAVVGLARYPFVTFAQPDLLQHPDQPVT